MNFKNASEATEHCFLFLIRKIYFGHMNFLFSKVRLKIRFCVVFMISESDFVFMISESDFVFMISESDFVFMISESDFVLYL